MVITIYIISIYNMSRNLKIHHHTEDYQHNEIDCFSELENELFMLEEMELMEDQPTPNVDNTFY